MKTIADLDVAKIDEQHLISLNEGTPFFRRAEGGPLEFQSNGGTFTTRISFENHTQSLIGHNSGSCCIIETKEGAFKESDSELRKVMNIIDQHKKEIEEKWNEYFNVK